MSSFDDWFRAQLPPLPPYARADVPEMTVVKHQAFVPVSYELLMDVGAIPDTREHKPIPRRLRFRWWRARKREYLAVWIYERVSGDKFPNPSDY